MPLLNSIAVLEMVLTSSNANRLNKLVFTKVEQPTTITYLCLEHSTDEEKEIEILSENC